MASLQTGIAGDRTGEVPTHTTRRPQTYRLVAGSHPGVIHVPGDSMYRVTPAPSQGEMRPGGRSGGDGTVISIT